MQAVLSLVDQGVQKPTASQISQHAGVSLRSVYQRFGELEDLFFEAATVRVSSIADAESPAPRSGPFPRRLDAFVSQRVRVLEALTPVRRSMLLSETSPRSAALVEQFRQRGKAQVSEVFASELGKLQRSERQDVLVALCVVSGWTAWSELRLAHRLSRARARRVMARAVRCLLKKEG